MGHTSGEPKYEHRVDPTCTQTGSCDKVVYCTTCSGEISRTNEVIPELGHSPAPAVRENVTDSTCYEEGSYEEVIYCLVAKCPCAKGGEDGQISRETKTIEKKEHTPGTRHENVIDPTCTEGGSYVLVTYCTVEGCGAVIESKNVTTDPLEHSFTNYVSNGDASCTEDGTKTATCDRDNCGATDTILDEGSAHHLNVISEVIPPSCEKDGYTEHKCTVCNESLGTEPGEKATGHTDEDEDNVCDTCGETICVHVWDVEYTWEIDLSDLEHPIVKCTATGKCVTENGCGRTQTATTSNVNIDNDSALMPDCENDGQVQFYVQFTESWLETEQVQYSEVTTVPKTGHSWVDVEEQANTCTTPGHTAYKYCSNTNCDAEIGYQDLPVLGHDYQDVVTPPTCSAEGYTTHTCSRCQDSYKDTYVDAADHVYSVTGCWDEKETWDQCSGCDARVNVQTRTYNVTIIDYLEQTTVRKGYTYGQYLWLNYSTSNVLELDYQGWLIVDKDGNPLSEVVKAYEVWETFVNCDAIMAGTTDLYVREVTVPTGVKYGAILMSVNYDKANSEKTMTVDLFLYVDALDDAHKPTVTFGGEEKELQLIDESLMMWFVSIDLSAAQITQGGDNVKITVSYNGIPVKTIDSVLIAYEKALEDYLDKNAGDYAGGAQNDAINAMLNYGKTVQVYFENQNPNDWAFKGYADIANYATNIAPKMKSNKDGTFTWMGANVRFDEEYSMRYEIELKFPEGVTAEDASATLVVRDKYGATVGDPFTQLEIVPKEITKEDGTKEIVPNRYYVTYPVPTSHLAKADTTVQMYIEMDGGSPIISEEYEYGIYAHLTYSVNTYMEYEDEDGNMYHKKLVSGDDQTGTKTKQYVNMLVSLLKLGEAVQRIEDMTTN